MIHPQAFPAWLIVTLALNVCWFVCGFAVGRCPRGSGLQPRSAAPLDLSRFTPLGAGQVIRNRRTRGRGLQPRFPVNLLDYRRN
jgi:hypothetical protein